MTFDVVSDAALNDCYSGSWSVPLLATLARIGTDRHQPRPILSARTPPRRTRFFTNNSTSVSKTNPGSIRAQRTFQVSSVSRSARIPARTSFLFSSSPAKPAVKPSRFDRGRGQRVIEQVRARTMPTNIPTVRLDANNQPPPSPPTPLPRLRPKQSKTLRAGEGSKNPRPRIRP